MPSHYLYAFAPYTRQAKAFLLSLLLLWSSGYADGHIIGYALEKRRRARLLSRYPLISLCIIASGLLWDGALFGSPFLGDLDCDRRLTCNLVDQRLNPSFSRHWTPKLERSVRSS